MNFYARKETQWTWWEENQRLELKDNAKWMIWIVPVLIFLPVAISLAYNLSSPDGVELFLQSIVLVPGLFVSAIWLKTASLKKQVSISEIELAVIKKSESYRTISLKLTNGRYRQLYFTARFQYQEFLEFLERQNIAIEERSLYWALPLNY